MIAEILDLYRRVRCNMQCEQRATLMIYGRTQTLKVCTICAAQIVTDLCEYGFGQRAAQAAIDRQDRR